MHRMLRHTLAAASMLACLAPVHAQPEPVAQRLVAEDDNVRIDELRVRGQTRSITVRSKTPGARPYEIITADGARDLSQDRRASGQRVWHVLSF